MRIKITSDSTCDLSREFLAENGVELFPLYVTKDGKSFRDGEDIFPKDIVEHVAKGGKLCSTSAVSIGDYADRFSILSAEYDGVIHISLGSGFSSSFRNACIAAEEFPNIRVIDSENLSSGQGHLVVNACRLAKSGLSPDEIAEELKDLAKRVEASFLLDRLDYMAKGGRCSSVAALGANLLQLKPCIEVSGGKMKVAKKYRGKLSKCLGDYIRERTADRDDIIRDLAFITHSPTDKDAVAAAMETAKACGFDSVAETDAGCTVTCHCGPNCLGVLFVRKKQ